MGGRPSSLPIMSAVPEIHRKQSYEAGKLAKRLRRQVGQAIGDYQMRMATR